VRTYLSRGLNEARDPLNKHLPSDRSRAWGQNSKGSGLGTRSPPHRLPDRPCVCLCASWVTMSNTISFPKPPVSLGLRVPSC
jgi:hypothetical protein